MLSRAEPLSPALPGSIRLTIPMDSVARLLISLYKLKATLWLEEGRLRYRAPAGAITGDIRNVLITRKTEITDFLTRSQSLPLIRDTISVDFLGGQRLGQLHSLSKLNRELTSTPYWEILRLQKPWELVDFSWDLQNKRLVYLIAWRANSLPRCPACDSAMAVQPGGVPQCWRHRSDCLNILICADIPRFRCAKHDTLSPHPPWLASYLHPLGDFCAELDRPIGTRFRQKLQKPSWQLRHDGAVRRMRPLADTWRSQRFARALTAVRSEPSSMVLPLEADPPFKTYHCFGAHPLSIVGAVTDLSPLLASHYINLSCNSTLSDGTIGVTIVPRKTIGHFVASGQCDIFDVSDPSLFKLNHSSKLIQLMVDRICQGWYSLFHVNKYYFPNHQAYMKRDCPHDCLAFGFDTTKGSFRIAMYLKDGHYGTGEVLFSDMCKGLTIRGSKLFLGHSICYTPLLLFVKPRRNIEFRFDRATACSNLADYLQSAPPDATLYARDDLKYAGDWEMTFGYPTKHRIFGLKSFAGVICHIKALITNGTEVEMAATRALWEHKKIMYSNIRAWTRGAGAAGTRMELYSEVVTWTRDLHLMCFAFNLRRDEVRKLKKHLERFLSIIEVEKEVLTETLSGLSETSL